MSVSSDEVNYLVYRYLQESGFVHSAFTFAQESLVSRSVVADTEVPPGALISFLQKGLQYVEIETHLQEDGQERQCDEAFHLLTPHVCRVKSVQAALSRGAEDSGAGSGGAEVSAADVTMLTGHGGEAFAVAWSPSSPDVLASGSADATARVWRLPDRPGADLGCTVLRHTAEGPGASGSKAPAADGKKKDKAGDVGAVAWSPDGSRLLTSCYDGRARVWGRDGSLLHTLSGHSAPLFVASWSPAGTHILTAGVDKNACVWDGGSGELKGTFAYHSAPVLAAEWLDDTTFATASTDKLLHVLAVGERAPIRTLTGHTDEVNTCAWSPALSGVSSGSGSAAAAASSNRLLASGSDDRTVRLWSMATASERDACVGIGSGHTKPVYCLAWSPSTASEGSSGSSSSLLASGSFDGTVRLWDPAALSSSSSGGSGGSSSGGKALAVLARHAAMVNDVAFSPDGGYVASAGADKRVHIASVREGAVIKTVTGPAAAFALSFHATGNKLAISYANGAVAVVDLRM